MNPSDLTGLCAWPPSSWTGGENGLRGFTVDKINLFGATINFLDPVNKYYVLMVFAATAMARGLGMQIW